MGATAKLTLFGVNFNTNMCYISRPRIGHAMERFCVSGRCFEYSDSVITSGFNNTSSHGARFARVSRFPVRITYLGNTLLKLEVAPDPETPNAEFEW